MEGPVKVLAQMVISGVCSSGISSCGGNQNLIFLPLYQVMGSPTTERLKVPELSTEMVTLTGAESTFVTTEKASEPVETLLYVAVFAVKVTESEDPATHGSLAVPMVRTGRVSVVPLMEAVPYASQVTARRRPPSRSASSASSSRRRGLAPTMVSDPEVEARPEGSETVAVVVPPVTQVKPTNRECGVSPVAIAVPLASFTPMATLRRRVCPWAKDRVNAKANLRSMALSDCTLGLQG
mmetsp:Transcript_105783/g.252323  ORF Transcript_105783/g.252323 Transcript_105783/m.252323 type:complete len:238 (+) Transcript_105783:588-1301(+)